MRNILFISLFALCFTACKKDPEIKGTRDLKSLSLPQLKKFLNGKWKWQKSIVFTIAGVDTVRNNGLNRLLEFFPVDSVKMTSENGVFLQEKLVYEYLQLPWRDAPKVNVLMFAHDGFGYLNQWVADRLENDTLIFVGYFRSEGENQYYYTRE